MDAPGGVRFSAVLNRTCAAAAIGRKPLGLRATRGKPYLLGASMLAVLLLSACGGSGPLKVAITSPPPSSMEIGGTTPITATVTNDPSNAGVDWSCTPSGSCGTFTPAHTASGAATTYQAPLTTGNVVITAASTHMPTVTATANVAINPIGTTSNLKGTYTYYANGWDTSSNAYSVVGSIALDGSGNVTGGEQDYFDGSGVIDTADPIKATGGSINLGADGRGTLTIPLTKMAVTETFSVVLVNNDHLLITEFDSSATSGGAMDLQTAPTSVPTGGNAFALVDAWDEAVAGGVATSNGTSFTAGTYDSDSSATIPASPVINQPLPAGGGFTPPDSAGRGTMSLGGEQFAYYVVGPEVFRLIETDRTAFFAGSMYGQGTAANAFSASSLKGTYAFGQYGFEFSGSAIFEYGAAGEFTTDASASLTAGVADLNEGDGRPVLAASLAGSTYSISSNGYGSLKLASALDTNVQNFGVYLVDPNLNIVDPNSTTGGGGALMLDLDTSNLGIGVIAPQSNGATFAGNYAFIQDGTYQAAASSAFFDLIGQVLSDGTAKLAGNGDYNDLVAPSGGGQFANETISATLAADPANKGRFTAQLSIIGNGSTTNENITLYQASDSLLFHVDMDSPSSQIGNTAVGVFEKQQ
jgi:hypothetical protein